MDFHLDSIKKLSKHSLDVTQGRAPIPPGSALIPPRRAQCWSTPRLGAERCRTEAGWLSKAEAAGEDGGSRSTAGLDRGAAAQRAATQEGHYQVSTGPRFRFGTRGGGAAGLVRLRDASPPRRCPYIPYPSVPPPSSSRGPWPGRPERPCLSLGAALPLFRPTLLGRVAQRYRLGLAGSNRRIRTLLESLSEDEGHENRNTGDVAEAGGRGVGLWMRPLEESAGC